MTGALVLIPWHIGNRLDVTLRAARAARELRVFLAEEPETTREQFERLLGVDCRGKTFLAVPERPDPRLLEQVAATLERESVGLISSGGAPCFIDPGAWVVAELRRRGAAITPLAGPSILSTMLSLSGVDWTGAHPRGTFVLYRFAGEPSFQDALRRDREPVFVFLPVGAFAECLGAARDALGERPVTAFFDLTKKTVGRYPFADRVETRSCREWLAAAPGLPWGEISDVALMIHPGGAP